jgi:hypothetical protein
MPPPIPKIRKWEDIETFIADNNIPYVGNEQALFDVATSHVTLDGLWMEFGVATGRTINYTAGKAPGIMHGFDSFEGLPEDWTLSLKKGAFKQEKLPSVVGNVHLVVGLFQDTLESFLAIHRDNVAYVHLDADIYSSTHYVLFTLAKKQRIHPGTIIQLDDIFYFEPGQNVWYTDEFRAFFEFVKRFKVKFKWLGYSGQRAAVKIIRTTNETLYLPITSRISRGWKGKWRHLAYHQCPGQVLARA